MHLTEKIVELCHWGILTFGYAGVFVLMFFESMYVPVPSEAVMPFVGLVAAETAAKTLAEGQPGLDLWIGCLVAALGGLGGSLTTYYFGLWAGPIGVRKWGRYGGLVEKDLDITQRFFDRWGSPTVFVFRFVPVVRHFISTVAGIAKMRLVPFVVMTTTGAFLWDLFLAWLGFQYGERFLKTLHDYNKAADIAVVVLGAIIIGYAIRHLRHRKIDGGAKPPSSAPPGPASIGPASDLDARQPSP